MFILSRHFLSLPQGEIHRLKQRLQHAEGEAKAAATQRERLFRRIDSLAASSSAMAAARPGMVFGSGGGGSGGGGGGGSLPASSQQFDSEEALALGAWWWVGWRVG